MPIYGQVVVGPPGSGKTTYCNGMQQYLRLIGRETLVVNLDPANEYHPPSTSTVENAAENAAATEKSANKSQHENENEHDSHLPYDTLLDTSEDVINLSTVMEEMELGPNGGLVYCLEYIHHHMDEFESMLRTKLELYSTSRNTSSDKSTPESSSSSNSYSYQYPYPYLLFDLPGQIELYTHSTTIQSLLSTLISNFDMRLVMVQLIDSHYCMDVYKFISSSLLSMTTMLRLELPAVNVLSKVDLLSNYAGKSSNGDIAGTSTGSDASQGGALSTSNLDDYDGSETDIGMPFNLDFFMECQELDRLLPYLDQHEYENHGDNALIQHILDNDEEYQAAKMKRIRNSQRRNRKHHKLHRELCDVVNDFSLVSYVPLNINDAASVGRVLSRIDKANGYIFTVASSSTTTTKASNGSGTGSGTDSGKNTVEDMFKCAMQVDKGWGYEQIADIQERYLGMYQDVLPELKK